MTRLYHKNHFIASFYFPVCFIDVPNPTAQCHYPHGVLCALHLQFYLCSLSSTQFFHTTYCSEDECCIHVHSIIPEDRRFQYLKVFVFTFKVKWSHYRPSVTQRVGRVIALLFHDHGTRRGWVVSSTPRPHFTPSKDPVTIAQEAAWAPGPVWTGRKSHAHQDSIPDCPACSRSLCRLSYRPTLYEIWKLFNDNNYTTTVSDVWTAFT